MIDDWAKRAREQAKLAIKDMNAVRNFPDGTCPASRHVAMMAETLAKGKKYHMLDSDREHCAASMAQTVTALWECRAKLAKAVDGFESIRQSVDHQLQGRLYRQDVDGWEACMDDINYVIRKILAELTGGKDE